MYECIYSLNVYVFHIFSKKQNVHNDSKYGRTSTCTCRIYVLVPFTTFLYLESRTKDSIFFRKIWNDFLLNDLGAIITCILPLLTSSSFSMKDTDLLISSIIHFYSILWWNVTDSMFLSYGLCKYLQRCSYVRNSSTYKNMKLSFSRHYRTWCQDHLLLLCALCWVKWNRGI